MDVENKKILTAVILVILLAITGYFYYRNRVPANYIFPSNTTSNPAPAFHGPISAPYVNGPIGLPPGR